MSTMLQVTLVLSMDCSTPCRLGPLAAHVMPTIAIVRTSPKVRRALAWQSVSKLFGLCTRLVSYTTMPEPIRGKMSSSAVHSLHVTSVSEILGIRSVLGTYRESLFASGLAAGGPCWLFLVSKGEVIGASCRRVKVLTSSPATATTDATLVSILMVPGRGQLTGCEPLTERRNINGCGV